MPATVLDMSAFGKVDRSCHPPPAPHTRDADRAPSVSFRDCLSPMSASATAHPKPQRPKSGMAGGGGCGAGG